MKHTRETPYASSRIDQRRNRCNRSEQPISSDLFEAARQKSSGGSTKVDPFAGRMNAPVAVVMRTVYPEGIPHFHFRITSCTRSPREIFLLHILFLHGLTRFIHFLFSFRASLIDKFSSFPRARGLESHTGNDYINAIAKAQFSQRITLGGKFSFKLDRSSNVRNWHATT